MTHPTTQPEVSGYFCYKKTPLELSKKSSCSRRSSSMCLYRTLDPLLRNQENWDQNPKRFFWRNWNRSEQHHQSSEDLIGAGLINEISRQPGKTPVVQLVIDQKDVYAKYWTNRMAGPGALGAASEMGRSTLWSRCGFSDGGILCKASGHDGGL